MFKKQADRQPDAPAQPAELVTMADFRSHELDRRTPRKGLLHSRD
jgi:hypothetical protein